MISLKLPPSRLRRRPQELSLSADERPSPGALLTLGLQHAAMALALSTYVLALARGAGLGQDETRMMMAATIVTMALGTGLQAWGGKLGAGALIVHIPTPVLLPIAVPILALSGAGALVLVTAVSAIVSLAVAPFAPRLRGLFPPIVTGLVVLIGGLSLVRGAVSHSAGLGPEQSMDGESLAISATTFAIIVVLSIWGGRRMKLFALLVGILAGVCMALLLGRLPGGESLAALPAFALPPLATPAFDVPLSALVGVAFIALLGQIDSIGCFILMDKMDDADWRRPDMRQAGRGMLAKGLSTLIGSALGSVTTATSSAHIGLCHASRVTSRHVGLAVAAILGVIAFLPQVTVILTLIPTPVIGAIEFYAAAFLIASGIDLVASRQLDTRGVFIIGISMVCGVGVLLMPGIASKAPAALHPLVGSGFIVTGLLAIVLNQFFRLGIRQTETQAITAGGPAPEIQVTEFVERMGGAWAARRDVVRRAAQAAVEVVEAVRAAGGQRAVVAITGRFDELNLDIELRHSGAPLPLAPATGGDLSALLDGDDDAAIDAAISTVSAVLIQRLADRLKTGVDPATNSAFLRLHFDH